MSKEQWDDADWLKDKAREITGSVKEHLIMKNASVAASTSRQVGKKLWELERGARPNLKVTTDRVGCLGASVAFFVKVVNAVQSDLGFPKSLRDTTAWRLCSGITSIEDVCAMGRVNKLEKFTDDKGQHGWLIVCLNKSLEVEGRIDFFLAWMLVDAPDANAS